MKLTNGVTVLRASINFEMDDAVVLARKDDEFVTWNAYRRDRDGAEEWDCELGHYYRFTNADSEAEARTTALADFRARAARRP